jgi:WhiB family transcriptional regulator, redox-sensing transcriptional regulator
VLDPRGCVDLFIQIIPILKMDWIDNAACAETDPHLFFPELGQEDLAIQAKRVCRGCGVQTDCDDWATSFPERGGIWAGSSRNKKKRAAA